MEYYNTPKKTIPPLLKEREGGLRHFFSAKRLSLLVARGLLSLEPLGRPRLADTGATPPRVAVASPEGAEDVAPGPAACTRAVDIV